MIGGKVDCRAIKTVCFQQVEMHAVAGWAPRRAAQSYMLCSSLAQLGAPAQLGVKDVAL